MQRRAAQGERAAREGPHPLVEDGASESALEQMQGDDDLLGVGRVHAGEHGVDEVMVHPVAGEPSGAGEMANPAKAASRADRSADWLYRRFNSRIQCSGIGATSISGRNKGCAARSSHPAAGRARSSLSPCFKASTICRALSL